MSCSAYLQGGLVKNKGEIGLFKISQKEGLFHLLDNQVLLGVISQCGPPICTFQKRPSSPLQFGQEENIRGHSMKSRAY